MLHLLSHEEANVTIEQQKDTHRHLSPAHFPYNGEETEVFFLFFWGGGGGFIFFSYRRNAFYHYFAPNICFWHLSGFHVKDRFPNSQMGHPDIVDCLKTEQHNHQLEEQRANT